MNLTNKIFTFLALLLFLCNHGFSQIRITKTTDPPVIDGRVNEKSWESATLINEFFQREPAQGMPLTEKTEVFIMYDEDHIYFGIKCYQYPNSIAAKEMLRGASLPYDDRMHIILDTYLDGRNAFFFEINPLGSIGDALLSESGRRSNRDWEGLFEGRSSITEHGWEAELAIPFKTLSFDKNRDSWGLFMNRFIPNKNEWGSWPVANINMPENAVSDAGIITGLEGMTQGIGLDITPYALTGYDSRRAENTEHRINAGTDVFYQIIPSMKASLSVNTDFAETEADTRQINLTRFSIRLREKRQFFLDGDNFFRFETEERRLIQGPSGILSPFFSRRIGLDAAGSTIPVNYGAKLAGRINNWNIGMLHISENREPANSYSTIARVSRNIGQQSSIGVISTYGNAINESQNFVAGLDLNLATSQFMGDKNLAFILLGIKSTTEDIKGKDAAWRAVLSYPNDLINLNLGYQEIGENFFAGLGFVPRTNIKESWGSLTFGPRLNKWGIRQYSFGGSFNYVTDFNNIMQSQSFSINPGSISFHSGESLSYSLNRRYEFLDRDFNIFSDFIIPADDYKGWDNLISLFTAGYRDIQGRISYQFGNFYTGWKNTYGITLNWKIAAPFFISGSISRNDVNLPEGKFYADIFTFNANILFSSNITLYNYLQYDSQSKTAGLQSRFRWILKPGNEILFVWNSGYSQPLQRIIMNENSMRLKLKYNFRF